MPAARDPCQERLGAAGGAALTPATPLGPILHPKPPTGLCPLAQVLEPFLMGCLTPLPCTRSFAEWKLVEKPDSLASAS